jgi:hypothetical protein
VKRSGKYPLSLDLVFASGAVGMSSSIYDSSLAFLQENKTAAYAIDVIFVALAMWRGYSVYIRVRAGHGARLLLRAIKNGHMTDIKTIQK